MDLGGIMLSEVNQTNVLRSHLHVAFKKQNKQTKKKAETGPSAQRTNLWFPEGREMGRWEKVLGGQWKVPASSYAMSNSRG